jgi:hypothetical protein
MTRRRGQRRVAHDPPHPYREDPTSLRCTCGLPAANQNHCDPPEHDPDAAALSARIIGERPDQED